MTRTFAIALSLLAGLQVVAEASAQDAPKRRLAEALRVEPRGAPCLTQEALTARVARWLGGDQIDASIGIDVWASAEPGGMQASFVVRREGAPSAERSFDVLPQECRARLAAMSLAIALAIDHTVLERIPSDELARLSGEESATSGDAGAKAEEARSDATGETAEEPADDPDGRDEEEEDVASGGRRTYGPGSGPDVSLAVGGLAAVAVVPGLAPGARAELGLAFGPTWSLRLSGLVVSEAEGDLGRGSVAAGLLAGAAHACAGTPLGRRLRLSGCAGLGVGAYSARGKDFQSTDETTREWMGVGAAAEVSLRLVADLALRLRPELLVPLVRPSLEVVDPAGVRLADLTAPALGALFGLEVLYPMP